MKECNGIQNKDANKSIKDKVPKKIKDLYSSMSKKAIDRIERHYSKKNNQDCTCTPKINTLCWTCKNCCNSQNHHCSWSDRSEPVDGWVALKTCLKKEKTTSYIVLDCPCYKKDPMAYYTSEEFREAFTKEYCQLQDDIMKTRKKKLENLLLEYRRLKNAWYNKHSLCKNGYEERIDSDLWKPIPIKQNIILKKKALRNVQSILIKERKKEESDYPSPFKYDDIMYIERRLDSQDNSES